MPKLKLTAAAVRDLPTPPTGKQVLYVDETLQGFGLRVGATSRVFYAEARVNGRTRRISIGPSNVFTPEEARKEAKKLLGKMAGGQDINAEKAEARARTMTLAEIRFRVSTPAMKKATSFSCQSELWRLRIRDGRLWY